MVYRIEHLQAWAQDLGGECLSDVYINNKTKYKWRCGQCDTEWEAMWYNVKCHNSWCPECKSSIREITVRAAFRENFPGEDFSKNQTAIGMELDGYSEKMGLAFEHDGMQHEERVVHYQRNEGDFEAQQERDARKDQLCIDAEITLLRIPDRHKLAFKNIRSHVRELIVDLGYAVPAELPSDAEFYASVRAARGESPYIDRVKEILGGRGETLRDEACPTREWPLYVTCLRGHEYETTFNNLERGRGCPRCAVNAPLVEGECKEAVEKRGYELLYSEIRTDNANNSRRYITVQCPNDKHEPTEVMWDNFKRGKGCTLCGSAKTGATKRLNGTESEARIAATGFAAIGEYRTLNGDLEFECPEGHRLTTSLKKLEIAQPDARCPACVAEAYEDVDLLDEYGPETDPIRTKLRWKCVRCGQVTTSTYRGMRIRKYRCGNKKCETR